MSDVAHEDRPNAKHDLSRAETEHLPPPMAAPVKRTARETAAPGASRISPGPVCVTAHGLRIRCTPDLSRDDNIISELHYHAVVTVLAVEGEWLRIAHRGGTAYIHGDYVEPIGRPRATPTQVPVAGGERGKPAPCIPVGREVYAIGGVLSRDRLRRGSAAIDLADPTAATTRLDDDQYRFKQRCYDLAVGRLGDHIYGGVARHDLAATENHQLVRMDCVPHLEAMLAALRADLAAGHPVNSASGGELPAPRDGGVTVGSAYRSLDEDRDLWDRCFQRCFVETIDHRAGLPGGPLGEAAAHWLVTEVIAWRKAPPGGSSHSNGNAVDLVRTVAGVPQPNDYNDQRDWRASWEYGWLLANAARFGFKNYPKEAWHWEWYA